MASWRGVTLDQRTADMMDEVVRLCPGITIDPTQGSYSGGAAASAGTHDGGGAIDLAAEQLGRDSRDLIVLAMRRVGFAAWLRTPDQSDWPYHIHGIAVGCPDLAPAAADQVDDYLAGRNGLAGNGPDDGPRDFHYVGITWEQYRAEQQEPEPEDEMKPWAVNVGDGWWLTDFATYKTGVTDLKVVEDGIALGAVALFNAGAAVSGPWVEHVDRLPRVDAA